MGAGQQHAVDASMRDALGRYRVDGEVRAPSATWILTARP
nr:L598 [uncultured bacterium]